MLNNIAFKFIIAKGQPKENSCIICSYLFQGCLQLTLHLTFIRHQKKYYFQSTSRRKKNKFSEWLTMYRKSDMVTTLKYLSCVNLLRCYFKKTQLLFKQLLDEKWGISFGGRWRSNFFSSASYTFFGRNRSFYFSLWEKYLKSFKSASIKLCWIFPLNAQNGAILLWVYNNIHAPHHHLNKWRVTNACLYFCSVLTTH